MISYAHAASEAIEAGAPAYAIFAALCIVFTALYLLPTLLATGRRMGKATVVLFLVNMLLGWTIIGWLVCLLWAALGQPSVQAAFYKQEAARR